MDGPWVGYPWAAQEEAKHPDPAGRQLEVNPPIANSSKCKIQGGIHAARKNYQTFDRVVDRGGCGPRFKPEARCRVVAEITPIAMHL